jgi:hypothetical protein
VVSKDCRYREVAMAPLPGPEVSWWHRGGQQASMPPFESRTSIGNAEVAKELNPSHSNSLGRWCHCHVAGSELGGSTPTFTNLRRRRPTLHREPQELIGGFQLGRTCTFLPLRTTAQSHREPSLGSSGRTAENAVVPGQGCTLRANTNSKRVQSNPSGVVHGFNSNTSWGSTSPCRNKSN